MTPGITAVLRTLHDGEQALEQRLRAAADTHRADHEIHHVARDLARWSALHATRIRGIAPDYGLTTPSVPSVPSVPSAPSAPSAGTDALNALADAPTKDAAAAPAFLHPTVFAESPSASLPPGLALLRDLTELHLAATANSLAWEMLAQAAQATRDTRLLDLAGACHPQTLRQMRWTNTQVKALTPQIVTSL